MKSVDIMKKYVDIIKSIDFVKSIDINEIC